MAERKAEMGMGTLVIFIALILVAAVAAKVLISTTGTLQSKALTTGKATSHEVGTSLRIIDTYAEDGSDQQLDWVYQTIKLSSGSDELRLSDMLMSLNLDDSSTQYQYTSTARCDNVSYTYNYTENTSSPNTPCEIAGCADVNFTPLNDTYYNRTYFGAKYQITGTNNKSGYLTKGDVVQVCFKSSRLVNESEKFKITVIPMVGAAMSIEGKTPDLMTDKRISLYP